MDIGNPKKQRLATSLAALVIGLAFCGIAAAGPYVYDGLVDPMEYANSGITGWHNDHNMSGSQFPAGGGQTTTFYWEKTTTEFRLGLLPPLSVKNMLWGDYLSMAVDGTTAYDELKLYYQHWCSPTGGATPDYNTGSNCAHHSGGLSELQSKIGSADYKTMVDSEKVVIDGDNFKVIDSEKGEKTIIGGGYKTSLTYLIKEGICDPSSCDAINTPMSFEFLWTGAGMAVGEAYKDWLAMASNDLIFHLSPERGGPDTPEIPGVPIPAAFWLFGTALIGFIGLSRRTNLS